MINTNVIPLQIGLDQYTQHDDDIAPFKDVVQPEDLIDSKRAFNELSSLDWSFENENTSFLTHDIHTYPAKFIPQIPAQLISRLSMHGDLILDPFGGSGTTAFEAVRLGRRATSIDANPIATLIAKVKTLKLDARDLVELHQIESSLKKYLCGQDSSPEKLLEQYSDLIPDIPNRTKWFSDISCGELAQIKYYINQMGSENAKNVANLALSKIIINVSFQDSETRYVSKMKNVKIGEPTTRYLSALKPLLEKIRKTESSLRYGVVNFITANTLMLSSKEIPDESIDLIVTSPPYGNAYDYHLYHRFRLLWLGYNPDTLRKIEIGSHLRHQHEKNGFDVYLGEMSQFLMLAFRVLKPGRYAAIVIGDSIYAGAHYNTADSLAREADGIGFHVLGNIPRSIHSTKRSVIQAGRRATDEKILILQKPPVNQTVTLQSPPYNLKAYERSLRIREVTSLIGVIPLSKGDHLEVDADPRILTKARRLTFTHSISYKNGFSESTWQAKLENGLVIVESLRKEPKYVTHGIHPYKGKFYPQLAKALINISGIKEGATVLDPFCGSGTTLLECYLNGLRSYGCDMNPLAAKIASAKTGILNVDPDILAHQARELRKQIQHAPKPLPSVRDQFSTEAITEIENWFAEPAILKINWILKSIRSVSFGSSRDFFEVILSSIIRDVSQQEPRDLRIRKRKDPLSDADVFGLFIAALDAQYERLQKFWSIRGYSPYNFIPAHVCSGDSRKIEPFTTMGLSRSSVDLILTSPPYATALPYIDTDRLSLLVLYGMNSSDRRPLEHNLIGSREITNKQKQEIEHKLEVKDSVGLPAPISDFLVNLQDLMITSDVGFRRKNVPSLLSRFFIDMKSVLSNCYYLLKDGGEAMIVIGDNTTSNNGNTIRIPTTDFIEIIGNDFGLETMERIPITVTTENMIHIKNAITKNLVIRMKK
jgi:DNA modification methylase